MRTLGRPLSPKDIILGDRIGEGQFGDVHTGILYPDVSLVYLSRVISSPSIHLSLIHVSVYVSYICVGYLSHGVCIIQGMFGIFKFPLNVYYYLV